MNKVFITSAVRTPTGSFLGALKSLSASNLGSIAIRAALEKSKITGEKVNEVYMGQVLQGGEGQAPSTQASLGAGIPTNVPSTTINKVCASGMKSIMLAAQNVQLGISPIMVAGGMESMSNVPFSSKRGLTFGNSALKDLLINDGLTDPGSKMLMGNCVEISAKKHGITREMQDKFAIDSYTRSQKSAANSLFEQEMVPVTIKSKKGPIVVCEDEEIKNFRPEKFPSLKPTFEKDGTITPANASKLSDGSSALVLMDEASINKINSTSSGNSEQVAPLARIVSYADASTEPIDFASAPALAIPTALLRANLSVADIAAWELNEAFSAVPLIAAKVLGLPYELINQKGGAVSLGHPLGSSGSRIVVTLIHSLKPGEYGCAAICNGGGGASAIVVQRL
ncbi:Acetyl-CoA acetyltransferase A, mitochondrial [Smittium culicis]|uniref:acetyl-CoA C-acetyltransferase n=1 Tax=Smittium culicis TaxID=133412 RepID=A0A1R1YQP1_9FUNG|nr:Acetyl-CoA acetyltransferase A, mitochondrial [Smittium culicis]